MGACRRNAWADIHQTKARRLVKLVAVMHRGLQASGRLHDGWSAEMRRSRNDGKVGMLRMVC